MAFETILFADDSELIRKLMCPFLRTQGYEVIEAADDAEAIAAATHHPCPIDLLISDVEMPGLNGPALAGRLLRRRPEMKSPFHLGLPGLRSWARGCSSSKALRATVSRAQSHRDPGRFDESS